MNFIFQASASSKISRGTASSAYQALTSLPAFVRSLNMKMLIFMFLIMGMSQSVMISQDYARSLTIGSPASQELVDSELTPSRLQLMKLPRFVSQLRFQLLGLLVFFLAALFDYQHLREWTWFLYFICLLALIGLFFTPAIANVHRWYRIRGLSMSVQPAEYAKLVAALAIAWYLEKCRSRVGSYLMTLGVIFITLPLFILILKQPDLGSALILIPLAAVSITFGGVHPVVARCMKWGGVGSILIVVSIFLGLIDYEVLYPWLKLFVKEYQIERLNPMTYHQLSSQTAISIGGMWGRGMWESHFSLGGWLPEATTDSVFAAWAEMFGFAGTVALLGLYLALLQQAVICALVAKDSFGQLLALGIATYLTVHIIVNIGMMCGLLPITGVPLPLMTYGGSSTLSNMAALGILQSIYARRFTF